MKEILLTLTRVQHKVMDVLCTMHGAIPAENLKPATLGALCAKKLVNVNDGRVCSTCTMLWNMTFHKKMFDVISDKCILSISTSIKMGYRVVALRTLREETGWGVHKAVEWMNLNYPK